jgi:hypothetical protein
LTENYSGTRISGQKKLQVKTKASFCLQDKK